MIGPVYANNGAPGPATGRQCFNGAAAVGDASGRYTEMAWQGAMFGACEQAGVAPGTALGTTALLALYNPVDSGKLLEVIHVGLGYISGTLGAGTVFIAIPAAFSATAPSSGTSLTVYKNRVGHQARPASAAAVGVVRSNCTVPAAPVARRPLCSLQASLASTAVAPWMVWADVGGAFVIEPGHYFQLQSIAAGGSSPLVAPSVEWNELLLT